MVKKYCYNHFSVIDRSWEDVCYYQTSSSQCCLGLHQI